MKAFRDLDDDACLTVSLRSGEVWFDSKEDVTGRQAYVRLAPEDARSLAACVLELSAPKDVLPPPPPPPAPPPIEIRKCAPISVSAPKLITGALFGLAAFLLTVAIATGGRAW